MKASHTIFSFAPELYARQFQTQGYVHIRNGVTASFLSHAREQASSLRTDEVTRWRIPGKKRQLLFRFPNEQSLKCLLDTLAVLSGLDRESLIVSERHIKLYDHLAPAFPIPHKDRAASQLAIGIPLAVPRKSRLILFPEHGRSTNTMMTAITCEDGLDADAPTQLVATDRSVVLNTRPRDVTVFLGSSMYHERMNAAGTTVLYLKANALGLDPLGEDPRNPDTSMSP